jgi:hypothetical protein
MNRLSIPLRLALTVLVITLLVACAPGEPAPSPEEIEAAIETAVAMTVEAEGEIATSVAMTVAARESEAAAAMPLPTATQTPTPEPLPTLTPVVATATPFTVAPSSGGGGGGGGSGTAKYSCDPDLGKRPFDNSEFRPNDTFDIKFTIMNTGTATWPAGYDLVYHSGPFMAPAFPAFIELPEMKPGDKFSVGPYDAFAPAEEGFHVMTFKLQGGFCYPYVAIIVK